MLERIRDMYYSFRLWLRFGIWDSPCDEDTPTCCCDYKCKSCPFADGCSM